MSISAKIELLGGEQVQHSLSPLVMHEAFKVAVVPEDRYSYQVHPFIPVDGLDLTGQLHDVLEAGQERGVTAWAVTAPYKRAVLAVPTVSYEDNETIATEATNLLVTSSSGWQAYNTDVIGIKHSLELKGVVMEGASVIVLGAGATAQSAIRAVVNMGAQHVTVANRTLASAEKLVDKCRLSSSGVSFTAAPLDIQDIAFDFAATEANLIINTTVPERGYDFDTSLNPIAEFTFLARATRACMDVNYHPRNSGFLLQARRDGVENCVGGEDMLIFQALGQFEILTGKFIDYASLQARYNRIKFALAEERRRRTGFDTSLE